MRLPLGIPPHQLHRISSGYSPPVGLNRGSGEKLWAKSRIGREDCGLPQKGLLESRHPMREM